MNHRLWRNGLFLLMLTMVAACQPGQKPAHDITFQVIDTDFSKGRLTHEQTIHLEDLVRFHGHLCDGLVVGALAMQEAMRQLYPDQPIDRTNLRVVSHSSPCLTDVAIYLTGSRYQFSTFYIDSSLPGLFLIQRLDNKTAVSVSLNEGVKPAAIDSLGRLAILGQLSPCAIDRLRQWEDDFSEKLLRSSADTLYTVQTIDDFQWTPNTRYNYVKTDVLNKSQPPCR